MTVYGYSQALADAVQMLSPTGEETISRENVAASNTLTTQNLVLSYFVARHTGNINSVATASTGTAAGATPTRCQVGIYSVAANGDITLIGSTANTTSLWATINTLYTTALSAPTPIATGSTYAVGLLVVTAATAPTVAGGPTTAPAAVQALAPRMSGVVTGQATLPASVVSASIANTTSNPYARLIP